MSSDIAEAQNLEREMTNQRKVAEMAKEIVQKTKASSRTSQTPAGQPKQTFKTDDEYVETLNQIFALFRLNYHNQYYAAWQDAEQVKQVKRFWLETLSDYSATIILRAAQQTIRVSDYLPTLNRMIVACQNCLCELGLPSPREAYIEACLAASPKADAIWTHAAVYLAGRDSGWFLLSNETEAKSWPIFKEHYERWAKRAAAGETLNSPTVERIVSSESPLTSIEDRSSQLAKLRKEVKL